MNSLVHQYNDKNHIANFPKEFLYYLKSIVDNRSGILPVPIDSKAEAKVYNSLDGVTVIHTKGKEMWLRTSEFTKWLTIATSYDIRGYTNIKIAYIHGRVHAMDIATELSDDYYMLYITFIP